MAKEATCPHTSCKIAQCFLPKSHNAACPQQFQRHPSSEPGSGCVMGQRLLEIKGYFRSEGKATWCQRLLSKADFQNETSPASVTRQKLIEVTGHGLPKEKRYQSSYTAWGQNREVVLGQKFFRTKITQGTRFCKVTGPKLIYFKCYSTGTEVTWGQTLLPVKG